MIGIARLGVLSKLALKLLEVKTGHNRLIFVIKLLLLEILIILLELNWLLLVILRYLGHILTINSLGNLGPKTLQLFVLKFLSLLSLRIGVGEIHDVWVIRLSLNVLILKLAL